MNVVPIIQTMEGSGTQAGESGAKPAPSPDFADFYDLFPRHEARKDALKAWGQLTDDAERLAAIVGAAAWRRILMARHAEGYCPLPASWLRGERYHDELPAQVTSTHASHQPAQSTPLPSRTAMPDSVKEMLRKIRGQA